MKTLKSLALAILMGAAIGSQAAAPAAAPALAAPTGAPSAAQVKAVHDLLAAMQAEKLMRLTAGSSRYASDAQRQAVMDKLNQVPAAQIYQRLAAPLARYVTTETATEMTRFYTSSYGKRVLHQTYNSGPSMYGNQDPVPTAAEKVELKRPALIKARQDLAAADAAIRHEAFALLRAIIK